MKEMYGTIDYRGITYKLVFNLNVMEEIQEKYGTVESWGALTDGSDGAEPNAKAIIYGFRAMLNEGIDMDNDENGTNVKPFTLKQVGRMISEIGFEKATAALSKTVLDSTQSESKNA